MLANAVEGNIPAVHGMALFAARSHLPAVDISMAICALAADVGEDQVDMTLGAGYFFVHSAQRISCFVVIEIRDAANGLPTGECVAIFAPHFQVAMWAVRTSPHLCRLRQSRHKQQQRPNHLR
jgi:hypothetical protein